MRPFGEWTSELTGKEDGSQMEYFGSTPNDFVRIEVETLLARNIPVIPVLVMEANMPSAQDLPESLSQLTFQNGTPVRRDPDFRNDIMPPGNETTS